MAEFVETTTFLTFPEAGYPPAPVVPTVNSARQVTDISVLLNSLDEAAAESGQSLADKRALKAELDVETASDILWSLNHPTLYSLLTMERGWSAERYEQWMTDLLCAQLLGDDPHAVVAGSADAS